MHDFDSKCESSLIQYNEIYLYLSVLVGFLMMSPMMHGKKIPGIIKKINKALFGKLYITRTVNTQMNVII